jgi:hypothetical protein
MATRNVLGYFLFQMGADLLLQIGILMAAAKESKPAHPITPSTKRLVTHHQADGADHLLPADATPSAAPA